ncbi:hypothetical protein CERZMDRAFT_82920 [Cercospora zeae-maydis SCOH1-5]|uniref:Hydrophobin n=1 Tax=Cercospora zeae-maydis SCOH1-5 TaxID=717836 RepID=A0A6A6FNP0_9PEZI|nr:hypothetical protein CERZMDRAFT_82920 [Cercospora zeae-maydis SCOH1-5]
MFSLLPIMPLSALSTTTTLFLLVSLCYASPIGFPDQIGSTFTCSANQNAGLCCPAEVRSNGGVEDCLVATQMVRRSRNPIESFTPFLHHECPTGMLSSIPVCCKSSFATQQTGEATINGLNCVSAEIPKPYLTRRYSRVAHLERPSETLAYTRSEREEVAESRMEAGSTEPRRLERRTLDSLTQIESEAQEPHPATLDDVAKVAKRLETIVHDSLQKINVATLADCKDDSVGFCKVPVGLPEEEEEEEEEEEKGHNTSTGIITSNDNSNKAKPHPKREYKLMARQSALDALTDPRLPELAERSELTRSLDAAGGLSARDAGRIASAERRLRGRIEQAVRVSQLVEERMSGTVKGGDDVESDGELSDVLSKRERRRRRSVDDDNGTRFGRAGVQETDMGRDLVDPLTSWPQLSGLRELKHADAWWYS